MLYHIRHITRYQYTGPVAEGVTEVRMYPLNTAHQQCTTHQLQVRPSARIYDYVDAWGNTVHHFTQPGVHQTMSITSLSEVQVQARDLLPDALPLEAWQAIDDLAAAGDAWEMLEPGEFTTRTARLDTLAHELNVTRRRDPLSLLYELNGALNRTFAYDSKSTTVDSPIDEALLHRRGV